MTYDELYALFQEWMQGHSGQEQYTYTAHVEGGQFQAEVHSVPEPSTLLLVSGALVAVAISKRRRK